MKTKNIIAQRGRTTITRRAAFTILMCGVGIFLSAVSSVPAQAQKQVPNFNGIWGHHDRSYRKPFIKDNEFAAGEVINGYNNEYLKPWVVESIVRDDMVSKSGRLAVTDHGACYPEGVLGEIGTLRVQILQTPTEINLLFPTYHTRTIYLNRPHTPNLKPSWFGESVGHFEGDTLVVDTKGVAMNPQKVTNFYGAPHTEALHVVERWRFLSENEKPNAGLPPGMFFHAPVSPNQVVPGSKVLRLTLTVTDPGAFKKPWTSTLDYFLLKDGYMPEAICAQNNRGDLALFTPTATAPDF